MNASISHQIDSVSRSDWVGAWYAAPMQMQPTHLTGRTLYQIVHLHVGGQQIRLRLSNRYGERPLMLTEMFVGRPVPGLPLHETAYPVLFQGRNTVTIEAGDSIVSDPINLPVEAFSDLGVSFVVAEGDILTGHWSAAQTSYVSAPGVGSAMTEVEELLSAYTLRTTAWWAITGVDVLPKKPLNVLIALGDSTTDGAGSTLDTNRRYPDVLARRIAAADQTRFMSVLNAGISFNELLTSRFPLAGEATLRRFAWDVLEQAAVTDLIVQIGINDLRRDSQAEAIITGLQQLATLARERHLRVFGSTVLPGSYTPEQIVQWRSVNTWLREQGSRWFDAIYDFAALLGDPEHEERYHPAFNSGDDIHPNDAGYQRMAEAVDLNLLTGSPAL